MNCIPARLCKLPADELVLVAVYGFGSDPMLLFNNLKMREKKRLCHIVTKVYLMRWHIEKYFKFKKQQFELKDLRVMSLKSIRNLNLPAMLAAGYIGLTSSVHEQERHKWLLCKKVKSILICAFPSPLVMIRLPLILMKPCASFRTD